MKKSLYAFTVGVLVFLVAVESISATIVLRRAAGANPAAIQTVVDQFRADLGGSNNGVNGHFTTGRREVNWDGVPDSFAAPNFLPPDFFNVNSPRGLVLNTIEFENGAALNNFIVSADSNNPTNTPVEFGDIDPSYPAIFQTFSAERLFVARNTSMLEVNFFIPGTNIPATVKGFGLVFTDPDVPSGGNASTLRCYAPDGSQIAAAAPIISNNGLSFVGAFGDAGERISRCVIESGNIRLQNGILDNGTSQDLVAMDDFIYGEPQAAQFHSGDADGDGVADARVFRPSVGTWFTLNSGSNTISIEQFGANGDLPIDGDFDGDSIADLAIFRPSEGGWYVKRSSSGTYITQSFGVGTDKPVAADYDKDGKTDIAVWRPSNGNYFVLRSSDNLTSFFSFPFGQNGDIPVQGAAQ